MRASAPDVPETAVDARELFPLQQARTRRFTLGVPRNIAISEDGTRVAFLRARAGDDPYTELWVLDLPDGTERRVAGDDAADGSDAELPVEERSRRERSREASTGIVRYSADPSLRRAVFDLNGALHVVDLSTGTSRRLETAASAVDPRIDPTGSRVAYVSAGALHVVDIDGGNDRVLLQPEGPDITYGLAEFVAAEEMDRQEGFWWSPDGSRVLVSRVDVGPVNRWYISDPDNPARVPREVAYPVAGSSNAVVTLVIADVGGGSVPVKWGTARFEYLVTAHWDRQALMIVVQSRDQRTMRVLDASLETGETRVVREAVDASWVDIVAGVPRHLADGSLVWTVDAENTKRLVVGDDVVTPPGLQVRSVLDVDGDTVLFTASTDPISTEVWAWERRAGAVRVAPESGAGICGARRRGTTTVVVQRSLDTPAVQVAVLRDHRSIAEIRSLAETPVVTPRVEMLRLGARDLRAALVWPAGHVPGAGSLPVLLDPYGGPGHQRVVAAQGPYLESQWFADQGFAVLVIDGAGTPGRGPAWERSISGGRSDLVLQDQVDGLAAAAERYSDLDISRVAIRGWSYGGFLSGLAVLQRPDVFHAGIAGAPNADQRLYDTHYTERFLGMPDENPEGYERMSLAPLAPGLVRPLMLVHGLSDDNVVVAHTLRLASALVDAGRPHELILLAGVTHSTNRPQSANLLLVQLDFLRRALQLA